MKTSSAIVAITSIAALCCVGQATAEVVRQEWVQLYDAQGTATTNGSGDQPRDLALDLHGDVVVTGISYDALGQRDDFYTAKYAEADGQLIWQQRYHAGEVDEPAALAIDPAGDVIVTGSSAIIGNQNIWDFYTAKYRHTDGALLWERRLNGPASGRDEARDVAVDALGNAVVTGSQAYYLDPNAPGDPNASRATGAEAYTAKLSAAGGEVLWEKSIRPSLSVAANASLQGRIVAVDNSNNVVVMVRGYSQGFVLIKYAAADGAVLWERLHVGPDADRFVEIAAMELDAADNIYAVGRSLVRGSFSGANSDFYAAKFDGATGQILWEQRYTLPFTSTDAFAALALDKANNLIATGATDSGSTFDYYTIKFAGADGARLWEKRYNGPDDRFDSAASVATDSAGNAIVTGVSYTGPGVSSADYLTLKYRGTDGALLWTRRYNGPANQEDIPVDVAATANGGAVVTGFSNNRYHDFLTLKYVPSGQALNISTRVIVGTGDNALIAGFIIAGDAPKKVLIRAIGPSLPVPGALANPRLELNTSGGAVIANDDWKKSNQMGVSDTAQQAVIEATGIPPSTDLEAALVVSLPPGAHTAVVRGASNGTGVGLVEVYDLDADAPAQLANISTRGQVQRGDNVMIGGFIIEGTHPAKVLLRAIGPSLPVNGALQDPTLELVDGQGNTITNDNWRETQESEIVGTTVPPIDDNEAAIVATLVPGAYTAVVRGKDDSIGVALVEGYNLQ